MVDVTENDDDDNNELFLSEENIDHYNLVGVDDENSTSSSPSTTTATAHADEATMSPSFHPGDHVWMWCEAAGGVRYQHHGIVLYAGNTTTSNSKQQQQQQMLKIADFTAPDSGTFALPDSIASGSTFNSNHRLPHWHGVRVTTYYNVSEWQKEEYATREEEDDNNNNNSTSLFCQDEDAIVLQRVKFLLSNPHLIPQYDLLVSNCETVAVWCKTGNFHTHQVSGFVNGGKRNSVTVAASSVLASSILGPLAIPAVVGAAISFSTFVIKEQSNVNVWRERTKILNEEFERWQERQEQQACMIL
ncbi:hypothetical protein ACHAWC_006777 [Mediolabrus comicus]